VELSGTVIKQITTQLEATADRNRSWLNISQLRRTLSGHGVLTPAVSVQGSNVELGGALEDPTNHQPCTHGAAVRRVSGVINPQPNLQVIGLPKLPSD
jgi:hypothetical protein